MINKQEFNETYEEFKKIVGKEELNKNKKNLIYKYKTLMPIIYMLDPGCEAVEKINKLFDKFKKDDDLYNLLKNIPDKFTHLKVPDDYFINLGYEKIKEVINERRK